jgi:hypothetical protein
MRMLLASLVFLAGCGGSVASESHCGPAPAAYVARTGSSCYISDGGVFTLADGNPAPMLMVCQDLTGDVIESWCEPTHQKM